MYEKLQIESLLQDPLSKPERGLGLFLMSTTRHTRAVFSAAVAPAMKANDMEMQPISIAFDSSSQLNVATAWLRRAEVIVADLSESGGDILYVLGLAHGMGRCPLLTVQAGFDLPFSLQALRYVEYRDTESESLLELREHLTRAIRVVLAATRSGG